MNSRCPTYCAVRIQHHLHPLSYLMAPGGWSKADKDSENVKSAVKSAMDHHFAGGLMTHEIIEASQQVVAGMNYNVTLKLTETSSNACRKHQFKIYRKLNGTHEVTESNDLGATP